jgi:hypothetical protein
MEDFHCCNRSPSRELLGPNEPLTMSCNGLGKVVDNLMILESQRLDNGTHAFDETAALRTMTAEGAAPPQDGRPIGAFKARFQRPCSFVCPPFVIPRTIQPTCLRKSMNRRFGPASISEARSSFSLGITNLVPRFFHKHVVIWREDFNQLLFKAAFNGPENSFLCLIRKRVFTFVITTA